MIAAMIVAMVNVIVAIMGKRSDNNSDSDNDNMAIAMTMAMAERSDNNDYSRAK